MSTRNNGDEGQRSSEQPTCQTQSSEPEATGEIHVASAQDSSKGHYVQSEFEGDLGLERPVVYPHHQTGAQTVYAFKAINAGSGPKLITSFSVEQDGKVEKLNDPLILPFKGELREFATCVYRGRIYTFGDFDKGSWRYDIRYKVSLDIAKQKWLPEGEDKSYSTGLTGGYDDWHLRGIVTCFRALAFNDKIYLFYYRDKRVRLATYDGNPEHEWTDHGVLKRFGKEFRFAPRFSVKVVNRGGDAFHWFQSSILLVGAPEGEQAFSMLMINRDNSVKGYGRSLPMRLGAAHDDQFSIGFGSVKGQAQADMVQLFFNNRGVGGEAHSLRCFEHQLSGALTPSYWRDTGIKNFRYLYSGFEPRATNSCDTLEVAVRSDDNPRNFRNLMIVLTTPSPGKMLITAHESDHFVCVKDSPALDMGAAGRVERGTWTLVGVIEGVPPFARNGRTDVAETSKVIYGQTSGRTVSVSESYKSSIGYSWGATKFFEIDVEAMRSFEIANELSKKISVSEEWTLTNTPTGNPGGKWGWLLYSIPTLQNRTYQRYSQTKTVVLSPRMHITRVEKIRLLLEKKALTEMGVRNSSDLQGWKQDLPAYPGVDAFLTGSLSVEDDERWSKTTLEVSQTKAKATSGAFESTVSVGLNVADLFGSSVRGSVGFSNHVRVESELSDHISAELTLPRGSAETAENVKKLVVQPAWLVPKEEATLQPGKRPRWMPAEYRQTSIIPWCLTWKVLAAE